MDVVNFFIGIDDYARLLSLLKALVTLWFRVCSRFQKMCVLPHSGRKTSRAA